MDQEKHIGYEIHTLDRMFGRRLCMLFEQQNITQMQSWIIRYLYEHQDQDVYQKDLELFFHIARSTATGVLQGLEKQGYLIRCSVPNDARLKRLVLTEKGVNIQKAVYRILDENEQKIRQNISEEDLKTFFRVMEHMKKNVESSSKNTSSTEEES